MPKRIIICTDGTWNHANPPPGVELTNAAQIYRLLADQGPDGVAQQTRYIEGIGVGGVVPYFKEGYTGQGTPEKIRAAYRHLCKHYEPGDEIYLFGVSRGAFTVRQLCQLIDFIGVLYDPSPKKIRAAYSLFCNSKPGEESRPRDHLQQRSHYPCLVKFVGAWDTVDALGIPVPGLRQLTQPRVGLHGASLGDHVQNAFHALSIDETRGAFRPTIWTDQPRSSRRIEQVWFAGNHGDVCGGFGKKGLSDVSLTWMVERAREFGLGFSDDELQRTLAPDLSTEPTSWTDIWGWLLPSTQRGILLTNPSTEWIHQSAAEKMRADEAYGPLALKMALETCGNSRVVC